MASAQLESAKDFHTKEIKNVEKKLKSTSIEWHHFPAEFTLLPRRKFTLPKQYQGILPQYTGDLVIHSAKVLFKNYNKDSYICWTDI